MRHLPTCLAIAFVAGMGAPTALAQGTAPITFTAASVGAAITNAGYSYTETTDSAGAPMLEVYVGSLPAQQVVVLFYECGGKPATCEDIMLWSWYALPQRVSADTINAWNASQRWTRAYIDSDKDPVLEMDINATGGIGGDALQILVNTYFHAASDFATHLGL